MIPASIVALIQQHRDQHHVFYPPYGNADHGPMTYLALHALGASPEAIQGFAVRYRERLVPLPSPPAAATADDWRQQLGNGDSYGGYLAFFDAEVARRGWREVVAEYLPHLLSGVVLGAFHPLIRLAYGIQFELPAEIAAGLAFMACTGVDERLLAASLREPLHLDAAGYFESWQPARDPAFAQGRFDARYDRVMAAVHLRPFAGLPGAGLAELSRACLDAFHATHDFFALHLVTGSQAFRICSPWAGPRAERVLSVALAAAYVVIGAPDVAPPQVEPAQLPVRELLAATDEHDIKLAYTCRSQAAAFADPTYEWVAAHYLAPRLRGG
jgi:hypothetical protein